MDIACLCDRVNSVLKGVHQQLVNKSWLKMSLSRYHEFRSEYYCVIVFIIFFLFVTQSGQLWRNSYFVCSLLIQYLKNNWQIPITLLTAKNNIKRNNNWLCFIVYYVTLLGIYFIIPILCIYVFKHIFKEIPFFLYMLHTPVK